MQIEKKNSTPSDRKLLVIDDDPDSLEIISEALSWEGYQVFKTTSANEGFKMCATWMPDLVVLDVNMPEKDGTELLKDIKQIDPFTMVMLISGNSSTDSIIAGLDAGGDDFIPKPFDPLELLARVRTQLRIKDLNDQLRVANERLKELVDIDDLTGLYNMRSVFKKLEHEIERSKRFGRSVCAIMMDMDLFKSVNDGHNHLFGSFVLSQVGLIIKDSCRNIDIPARYGGDEFLIILTETNKEGAIIFCERLRKKIAAFKFVQDKDQIQLTASIGFAITDSGDSITDSRSLVRAADAALYEAKRAGRNCVKFKEIKTVTKGSKGDKIDHLELIKKKIS